VDATPPSTIERLIDESRALRKQLHDLIERLQQERTHWSLETATLPRRARLTPSQRLRFRVHLTKLRGRRVR